MEKTKEIDILLKSFKEVDRKIKILKRILQTMFLLLVLFSMSCEVGVQNDFIVYVKN